MVFANRSWIEKLFPSTPVKGVIRLMILTHQVKTLEKRRIAIQIVFDLPWNGNQNAIFESHKVLVPSGPLGRVRIILPMQPNGSVIEERDCTDASLNG
jgi:hypothetical protein